MANADIVIALLLAFAVCRPAEGQTAKYAGSILVESPGQLGIFEHVGQNGTSKFSLLASAYSLENDTADKAYMMVRPGEALAAGFSGYAGKPLSNSLKWPKRMRQVPHSVFDSDAIAIPDGSRIAGKRNGHVYATFVSEPDFPTTFTLTDGLVAEPRFYNYADTLWLTNARLGSNYMLSCRTHYSGDRLDAAQLVLYEPRKLGDPWLATVLKDAACDSNLVAYSVADGREVWQVVYATGVATKRLDFFWSQTDSGHPGDWTDPNNIRSAILSEGRQFLDVQVADVNADGKLDLLVTVISNTSGSLEVWEIPEDFRDVGQYKVHVISSGFRTRSGEAGRSPGSVKTFYPNTGQGGKPWILLGGGDDGKSYYIQPLTTPSDEWFYQLNILSDEGENESVGGVEAADVDGDGYTEIFVSVHNKNQINAYTFKN